MQPARTSRDTHIVGDDYAKLPHLVLPVNLREAEKREEVSEKATVEFLYVNVF